MRRLNYKISKCKTNKRGKESKKKKHTYFYVETESDGKKKKKKKTEEKLTWFERRGKKPEKNKQNIYVTVSDTEQIDFMYR